MPFGVSENFLTKLKAGFERNHVYKSYKSYTTYMLTLAFDTSGKSQGIALLDNDKVLAEIFSLQAASHSETLLPGIDEILRHAGRKLTDIDLFALTVGPGSFTGLRIGISALKALCRVHEKPVAPISTLLALAEPHSIPGQTVIPCLDARLGEVFIAAYHGNSTGMGEKISDQAVPLEKLLELLPQIPGKKCLVGTGAILHADKLRALPDTWIPPENEAHAVSPSAVGRLGLKALAVSSRETKPRYFRLSEAENRLRRGAGINLT